MHTGDDLEKKSENLKKGAWLNCCLKLPFLKKMVLVPLSISPDIRGNLGKLELVVDLSYPTKGIKHLQIEKNMKNVISGP